MLSSLRAFVIAPSLFAVALGCARPRYFQVDTVTAAPGGFWLAGTEGMAAFSDGSTVVRHDYPRSADAPEWAYEPFTLPAAHVVIVGGEPWLFTRLREILRFGPAGWTRVPTRYPVPSSGYESLDLAIAAPGGSILVQLHPDLLLWASPAELGARWSAERTPTYFTWLGFISGELYGLGWLSNGNDRALYRRAGRERWDVVSALGKGGEFGELRWVMRVPEGPLAVVSNRGLVIIDKEGRAPELLPANDLLAGRHPRPRAPVQVAAAHSPVQDGGSPNEPRSALPASPPSAAAAVPSPSKVARPALHVAAPVRSSPPPSDVLGVFTPEGYGPLLVVSGTQPAIVEITADEVIVRRCDEIATFVGAVTTPAGLRLVTREAALVAVDEQGSCRVVAAPEPGFSRHQPVPEPAPGAHPP